MAKNDSPKDTEKMKKILNNLKKKMDQIDGEKEKLDKKTIPKFNPLKAIMLVLVTLE